MGNTSEFYDRVMESAVEDDDAIRDEVLSGRAKKLYDRKYEAYPKNDTDIESGVDSDLEYPVTSATPKSADSLDQPKLDTNLSSILGENKEDEKSDGSFKPVDFEFSPRTYSGSKFDSNKAFEDWEKRLTELESDKPKELSSTAEYERKQAEDSIGRRELAHNLIQGLAQMAGGLYGKNTGLNIGKIDIGAKDFSKELDRVQQDYKDQLDRAWKKHKISTAEWRGKVEDAKDLFTESNRLEQNRESLDRAAFNNAESYRYNAALKQNNNLNDASKLNFSALQRDKDMASKESLAERKLASTENIASELNDTRVKITQMGLDVALKKLEEVKNNNIQKNKLAERKTYLEIEIKDAQNDIAKQAIVGKLELEYRKLDQASDNLQEKIEADEGMLRAKLENAPDAKEVLRSYFVQQGRLKVAEGQLELAQKKQNDVLYKQDYDAKRSLYNTLNKDLHSINIKDEGSEAKLYRTYIEMAVLSGQTPEEARAKADALVEDANERIGSDTDMKKLYNSMVKDLPVMQMTTIERGESTQQKPKQSKPAKSGSAPVVGKKKDSLTGRIYETINDQYHRWLD